MTLTDEQKQALREKTASAKTQSKLKDQHAGEIGWCDENNVWHDGLKPLDDNVSRETYPMVTETIPGTASAHFEYEPTIGTPEEAFEVAQSIAAGEAAQEVANIPWNGGQPFQDAEVGTITSLVPLKEQAIVEGFTIPPGMNEDAVLDLSSAIYTYIGPIPVHIGRYTNKWFKVLGCCVQPLEGDVVNERTGEVEHIKWERPLFKLDKVDPDTGENIIACGGGIRGLQIARHFNAISVQFGWTVGDFKRPRMFYVQQENRENAHVMYGFRHRACTDDEMSK